MQKAYFPMKNLKISQSYGVGTHKYSYAIDLCGKDGGAENVFAPFDCKITKLFQPADTKKNSNTMWITSTEKVLSPNGEYDYLTIAITHPNEISKMKVGTKFKAGEVMCKEGTTGGVGNHIHLEVSKGTKAGWVYTNGYYVNVNKVKPEQYLFVKKDSVILDSNYKGTKIKFVVDKDVTKKVISTNGLNVRNKPSILGKKVGFLKYGAKVTIYDVKGSWSKISLDKEEWTSSNYLK